MSTNARRRLTITYSGDVEGEQILDANDNATSPGAVEMKPLVSGDNTVTVPTAAAPTAVTIVPTLRNGASDTLTLKGVAGDTGVKLHSTDPTTIALRSNQSSFILNLVLVEGTTGSHARLFWS